MKNIPKSFIKIIITKMDIYWTEIELKYILENLIE